MVLHRWYRQQLKELIPPLVEKWQAILGVQIADWGIKKMKTNWGTCNSDARRIWLNLELAKKPIQCLEYISSTNWCTLWSGITMTGSSR